MSSSTIRPLTPTTRPSSGTHDPSIAVVELFARLLDVDPVDIEPLADSIDPAALDVLLQAQ